MTIARKDSLVIQRVGDYEIRSAELGEFTASFKLMPKGFAPPAELFDGTPGNACNCPHWGYMTKGVVRYTFADGTIETVRAGDVYYIKPGHHVECVEAAEAIDFSPTKPLRDVIEVVNRNMQRAV